MWYTSSNLQPVSQRQEKGATWSDLGARFWGTRIVQLNQHSDCSAMVLSNDRAPTLEDRLCTALCLSSNTFAKLCWSLMPSPFLFFFQELFCDRNVNVTAGDTPNFMSGSLCPDNQPCVLYGQNPNFGYTAFDHVPLVFLSIFQCMTGEGWSDIMYLVWVMFA